MHVLGYSGIKSGEHWSRLLLCFVIMIIGLFHGTGFG